MKNMPNQFHIEPEITDSRHAHKSGDEEKNFIQAVISGDIDFVRKSCEEKRFTDSNGVGQFSTDAITNLKYHCEI